MNYLYDIPNKKLTKYLLHNLHHTTKIITPQAVSAAVSSPIAFSFV